jgi:hypothetical protein
MTGVWEDVSFWTPIRFYGLFVPCFALGLILEMTPGRIGPFA